MEVQDMLFQFLGGLGIFLFGLQFMGDGLKQSAGDNLRSILNKFTSTPIRAVLAGVAVTVLIQSSSGTTVLAIGLVSAGFMSLQQAIGIIMGANIGTTITAFIIGLDIGKLALPIIAVGAFLIFFFKKDRINYIGETVFGFGALFYGLELMSSGLEPLQSMPFFNNLMLSFSSNPLLGVLAGTVVTMLMQSSSATTGIVQSMYAQGSMELSAALPLVFGTNIGTTITAVLAAIGASLSAKRASAAHVIFNIIATIFVMLVFNPYLALIEYLAEVFSLSPEMQIAFAHGIFNLVAVLILIWFIPQIAKLVSKIVPGADDDLPKYESYMDRSLIKSSPIIAFGQVKKEIGQIGKFASKEFEYTYKYYHSKKDAHHDKVMQIEDIVDHIDGKITEFLMILSVKDMPDQYSQDYNKMTEVTKYIERIGDHSQSIAQIIHDIYPKYKDKNKKPEDILYNEKVEKLFTMVNDNIDQVLQSYQDNDEAGANQVLEREAAIDILEDELRNEYLDHLNKGEGKPSDSVLFIDLVANLERISDHTSRIAKHILGIRYPFQNKNKGETKLEAN